MFLVKMDQQIPPGRNLLPKPACCALLRAACGVCCGMGRVFVGVCEREEACVQMMSDCVKWGVQNGIHTICYPKLVNQPGAVIHSNSRPP